MFQKVIVVGNLGRDPEMRYTPSGKPVTNMSVAVNRVWTDAEGQQQKDTTWFRVVVWGKQAEACNQYLTKGRLVLVEGEIRTRQYEDKGGQTRYAWDLVARNVRFLGGRGDSSEAPAGAAPVEVEEEGEIPF